MLRSGGRGWRAAVVAGVLFGALALSVASAQAKAKVAVLGWTTQAGANAPQVKNKETIDTCLDDGLGQRTLHVIFRGTGIAKHTKVGVGVWGGPSSGGFATEPSDADVMRSAFKWPVGPKETSVQSYGFSFAVGPFGPQNIDGKWQAKILLKGKQVAKGQVTVACNS